MAGQRMTEVSKANLQMADKAGFSPFIDKDGLQDGWLVWVEKSGNRAYLSGRFGPLIYPDFYVAKKAVRRVRPDLTKTMGTI